MTEEKSRLRDSLTFRNGKTSPERSSSGTMPVFGSNGIIGFSDEQNVEGASIIIGRVGSYCGSTYFSDSSCWVTDNAIVAQAIEPDETRFWYYALNSIGLNRLSHGSGQPLLNQSILNNIEFEAPHRSERLAIAATLGALDDKIESNRRAIRSAMALAEAIYQRVAALACKKRLGDHSTLVLGGTPSRKRTELWEGGTVPWIASGAANADIVMEPTEFITQAALDGSAAKMMPKGATVLAITGATLGQVALLGISTSGNQSLVGVWGETESTTSWLHFALRASVEELVKSATGAAQQHVNKGNVGDLMVPIPGPDELQAWSEVCVPLIERAIQLSAESRNLSTMRDALLPELLSGRIRAADVEVAQ